MVKLISSWYSAIRKATAYEKRYYHVLQEAPDENTTTLEQAYIQVCERRGNGWTKSFSEASKRALGFYNGDHGCRHSFAQHWMECHQSVGYSYPQFNKQVHREA